MLNIMICNAVNCFGENRIFNEKKIVGIFYHADQQGLISEYLGLNVGSSYLIDSQWRGRGILRTCFLNLFQVYCFLVLLHVVPHGTNRSSAPNVFVCKAIQ